MKALRGAYKPISYIFHTGLISVIGAKKQNNGKALLTI
jgi:hypothetical protein